MDLVSAVSAEDVRRVAAGYLERRADPAVFELVGRVRSMVVGYTYRPLPNTR